MKLTYLYDTQSILQKTIYYYRYLYIIGVVDNDFIEAGVRIKHREDVCLEPYFY